MSIFTRTSSKLHVFLVVIRQLLSAEIPSHKFLFSMAMQFSNEPASDIGKKDDLA
jgi:hypothetical protein